MTDLSLPGAPWEQIPFEEVDYWEELRGDHGVDQDTCNIYTASVLGAQAGFIITMGLIKCSFQRKCSVYSDTGEKQKDPLVRGFDDVFYVRLIPVIQRDSDGTGGVR